MTREAYLKHKDLIEAWVNGAEIEYFSNVHKIWRIDEYPTWCDNIKYRIKPKQTITEWLEENNSDYVPDWNSININIGSKAKYTIYYSNGYAKWEWAMTYGDRMYGAIYMSEETAYKLIDLLNKGEVVES